MESAGKKTQGRRIRADRRLKTKTMLQRVSDVRRKTILDALRKTGWNRTEAARYLKISRSTFYRIVSIHFLPGELSDIEQFRPRP